MRHDLTSTIESNAVVVHPITWKGRACLRVELIGCASGTVLHYISE